MAAAVRLLAGGKFANFTAINSLFRPLGSSWCVLSGRLLHRNSGLTSTNPALQEHNPHENALIAQEDLGKGVVTSVNAQVAGRTAGRLFAVVKVGNKQRKVTAEDLLIVEDIFPPTVGDRIRLEKVLMVGGKDFTAIGRPILRNDEVTVEATVMEKTLDVAKPVSYYRRRKNFRRLKLAQPVFTVLRINKIDFHGLRD